MLKILNVLLLSMLVVSTVGASLTPQQEIDVLKEAAIIFDRVPGHPRADEIADINDNIQMRLEFLDTRADADETYIIINIGSQRLTAVRNGKVNHWQKVIVGTDARPTPQFSDVLRYMVTKPYWNVPSNIAKLDIIPKLVENPELLHTLGYEMVDTATDRVVVFNQYADLRNFRIRQKPSNINTLGTIKFMFDPVPNRSVFLHDTPDGHLFNTEQRRHTSGNILVENPTKLGMYLLRKPIPQSSNLDHLIMLPKPVTVHIVDWPVYVNESNDIITSTTNEEGFIFMTEFGPEIIQF